MKRDSINLNHNVRVKLTEHGVNIFRTYHNDVEPEVDEDGYTTFQLWTLMAMFGAHVGLAFPNGLPFESEILFGRDNLYHAVVTLRNGDTIKMVCKSEEEFDRMITYPWFCDMNNTRVLRDEVIVMKEARGW